jgi:hypothetical protein
MSFREGAYRELSAQHVPFIINAPMQENTAHLVLRWWTAPESVATEMPGFSRYVKKTFDD